MKSTTSIRFPFNRAAIGVGALALACASALWAINDKNPGPEQVEIKFKLPPPKPLSPA